MLVLYVCCSQFWSLELHIQKIFRMVSPDAASLNFGPAECAIKALDWSVSFIFNQVLPEISKSVHGKYTIIN